MGQGLCVLTTLVFFLRIGALHGEKVCFICGCKPVASSHIIMRNVAKGLLDLGHNVTVVLPEHLSTDKEKYTFDGVEIIWYDSISQEILDLKHQFLNSMVDSGTLSISTKRMREELWTRCVESIIYDNILFKKLKQNNFDLMVLDTVPKQLSIIPYRLSVPFVYVTPFYIPWDYGIPFSTSCIPNLFTPFSDKMTLTQRLLNTFFTVTRITIDRWGDTQAVARLAPDSPYITLPELNQKAELWIVQSNSLVEYAYPTLPNVKLIGGLTVETPKKLPTQLNEFIDSSVDGIILMSFGSSNISLPDSVIDIFAKTFSALQYNVIWRTNKAMEWKNILNVSWVPQNDILGNDNTRLFINHCGANGIYEAVYYAVPIMCIPLNGDEYYFAESITRKGYGREIDWRQINQSDLQLVIEDLLKNSSYSENVKRASLIMQSSGVLPRDEAAYWIGHVIKYGGTYMRSESQNMIWYKYLLLDVAVVCISLISINVYIFMKVMKCIILRLKNFGKCKTD